MREFRMGQSRTHAAPGASGPLHLRWQGGRHQFAPLVVSHVLVALNRRLLFYAISSGHSSNALRRCSINSARRSSVSTFPFALAVALTVNESPFNSPASRASARIAASRSDALAVMSLAIAQAISRRSCIVNVIAFALCSCSSPTRERIPSFPISRGPNTSAFFSFP